jgi:CHAD domain-containing protein
VLSPDSAPADDLLDQLVRRLSAFLPRALAGDERSVHQLRVTARRLRAALPLVAARQGRLVRRARRALKRLTRTAGRARDLDVMAGLFEPRCAGEAGGDDLSRRRVRHRLRVARRREQRAMAGALLDLDLARLRADLRRLRERGGAGLFVAAARTRAEAERLARRLAGHLAELGRGFDPERLHRARRLARRLRYVAEAFAGLRQASSPAVAMLKELQDLMGEVHDTHVLERWLNELGGRAKAQGDHALAAGAAAEAGFFAEESRRRHEDFLDRDPRLLAAHALEAMTAGPQAA